MKILNKYFIKCKAFNMDAEEALKHIKENWEVVENYGDKKYGHHLLLVRVLSHLHHKQQFAHQPHYLHNHRI